MNKQITQEARAQSEREVRAQLHAWAYNYLHRGDEIKRYQYVRKPRSRDILLYCDDIQSYINISDVNDTMAYAPFNIPQDKTWISTNPPLEELRQ